MEKEIGKIAHWYDKISVGVIKLSAKLKVGDKIKIKKGDNEFEEEVVSMQLDHENVSSGKKGDEIAVKFSQKAKDGAVVYLVE